MRLRLVFVLGLATLVALPAIAQERGQERGQQERGQQPRSEQRGQQHRNLGHPRANQGKIPPPPQPRAERNTARQPERMPIGHVNETPHVNHDTWYGHEAANDQRFHLEHPFEHGHFDHEGPKFRFGVRRIDRDRHIFWLPSGGSFLIADWDWPLAVDWCWDCGDDFVVYDDPDHPGWYLVYDVETGAYIHAQYMGVS